MVGNVIVLMAGDRDDLPVLRDRQCDLGRGLAHSRAHGRGRDRDRPEPGPQHVLPRISGDQSRAAYDSRGLSLLATPDNFVRSINDAVNYQFGFDITSPRGYQLLRSGAG